MDIDQSIKPNKTFNSLLFMLFFAYYDSFET